MFQPINALGKGSKYVRVTNGEVEMVVRQNGETLKVLAPTESAIFAHSDDLEAICLNENEQGTFSMMTPVVF